MAVSRHDVGHDRRFSLGLRRRQGLAVAGVCGSMFCRANSFLRVYFLANNYSSFMAGDVLVEQQQSIFILV